MRSRDEFARATLAPLIASRRVPLVINSFGRSGSTVLYKAITHSAPRSYFRSSRTAAWLVGGEAWDLKEKRLKPSRIYKTHDRTSNVSDETAETARFVYIFGDPVEATASVIAHTRTYGEAWLAEHCEHLRVPPTTTDKLISEDALSLRSHLEEWIAQSRMTVAYVRYEALWDSIPELSQFLGFPIDLPAKRRRKSKATDQSTREVLERTYGELRTVIERLPDFHIKTASDSQ